ncbi:MAG: M20 peptidase family dipeptidase, partial [Rhizobiales bacterium]|nr:M20 peptidase family dipeptidase [Hyphomicrobiales bacterium]
MNSAGTREGAVARSLDYFDSGTFEQELAKRVSYRTESQKPDTLEALHAYLDEDIIPAFEAMGFA